MDKELPWKIADLVIARLNDSITEAESVKLDEWIAASADHRRLYEKWISTENFEAFRKESLEYSYMPKYADLCHHIGVSRRKRYLKRWGYAAAVIVIPVVFFCWEYLRSRPDPVPVNEQIIPGQYQALLTLPNGHTVNLSSDRGGYELENTPATLCGDTLTYNGHSASSSGEQFHRLSVPRGGEYVLRLSDGTQVWLNSETELRYPAVFAGHERKVFLQGEAYFEVAHDSLHPFRVETGPQVLTVLGTAFSIRAYGDEPVIMTTLERGRVNICSDFQEVELTPGYQSCLKEGRLTTEKVNVSLYTAWHKGLFMFMDESLGDIMNTLSRWYNMDIFYTASDLKDIQFTGELQRYGDIREFLDKLQVLEKVKFDVKGKAVTVSRY